MNYKLVRRLFEQLEKFEADQPNQDSSEVDFAHWILAKQPTPHLGKTPQVEGLISMYIGFLYKYAVYYSRIIFKDSTLNSLDDFGILITLYPDQRIKKIEVLKRNILEKSTGIEILKRLISQGYVEEKENEDDKRSKLVFLSEKGKKAIEALQKSVDELAVKVAGNLTSEEKEFLRVILHKLHTYHKPFFESGSYPGA